MKSTSLPGQVFCLQAKVEADDFDPRQFPLSRIGCFPFPDFRFHNPVKLNPSDHMNKPTKIDIQRGPLRLLQLLRGAVLLLLMTGAISMSQAQTVSLVPWEQAWKYEQSNIDLGTAWREPGYDDSGPGWGTGAAPLGFPINEGTFTSGLTVQTLVARPLIPS
jgi:hypothetical protein